MCAVTGTALMCFVVLSLLFLADSHDIFSSCHFINNVLSVHYSELNQEWHFKSKTVAEIESNLN